MQCQRGPRNQTAHRDEGRHRAGRGEVNAQERYGWARGLGPTISAAASSAFAGTRPTSSPIRTDPTLAKGD